jgi:hypothetical protein
MDAETISSFTADPFTIGTALNAQFGRNEMVIIEHVGGKVLRAAGRRTETGWTWTLMVGGARVTGGSMPNRIGLFAATRHAIDICAAAADHDPSFASDDPQKCADRLAQAYQRELARMSDKELKRTRWLNAIRRDD